MPAELIPGEEGEKDIGGAQKYDSDQENKNTAAVKPEENWKLMKPTRRYAPKPKRVIIPWEVRWMRECLCIPHWCPRSHNKIIKFIILQTPWESRASLGGGQVGMGPFGKQKDAVTHVDQVGRGFDCLYKLWMPLLGNVYKEVSIFEEHVVSIAFVDLKITLPSKVVFYACWLVAFGQLHLDTFLELFVKGCM
jgi:hypothetical protein